MQSTRQQKCLLLCTRQTVSCIDDHSRRLGEPLQVCPPRAGAHIGTPGADLQVAVLGPPQQTVLCVDILDDGDVIDDKGGAVLRHLHLLYGHVTAVVEGEAGVAVLCAAEARPRHRVPGERWFRLIAALSKTYLLVYELNRGIP